MANKLKNKTSLSPAEQKTTAAFKLKTAEIKVLKQSLKKTQDQLESIREEKFDLEKVNIVLENKLKNNFWIEFFKFISAGGFGLAANYFISNNFSLAFSIGIPSVIIYIVILLLNKS